jgi:phage protein U
MAKIGSFGDIVFEVSDKTVKTFDGMSWKVSASYATHDRHLREDLLEFLGPEPGSVSFDMNFSALLGATPLVEIERLQKMAREGITGRLVIGGKVYGTYMWVITDVSTNLDKFDNAGGLWAASVKVTLKEYAKR